MRTFIDNENRFIEMFDPKTGFYQRSSILDKDGIETDEVQWIFEVRGTHLDYKPPEVKKTNVLKMTKATENRLLNRDKTKDQNKKNNKK